MIPARKTKPAEIRMLGIPNAALQQLWDLRKSTGHSIHNLAVMAIEDFIARHTPEGEERPCKCQERESQP